MGNLNTPGTLLLLLAGGACPGSADVAVWRSSFPSDNHAVRFGDLRQALDYDPYPLARRLAPLKAILAKLVRQPRGRNRCHRSSPAWGRASGVEGGSDEAETGSLHQHYGAMA